MSGFIAIVNTNGAPVDRPLLETLTTELRFKGPDRQQEWIDGSVGLGHALFRTTDEAQYEYQPACMDGKFWITGSIRIDAREQLADKLGITKDTRLHQTPDAELALRAYCQWGEDCVNHLLGDFAFAIWDETKRQLFCARDRFGMRQLYYAQKGQSLIISNSLHVMLAHPAISRDLNARAIGGFLLFGDHNWLDKSITAFADVNVVLPAHSLALRNGQLEFRQYWDLPVDTPLLNYRNEGDYIEHFRELFEIAVADRIRTSKIVISMSGGMDSSAVAATAQKVITRKYPQPELSAATVIHEKLYQCEERLYSGLVAGKLGLPIHYFSGDSYEFLSKGCPTTSPSEDLQPDLLLDFRRGLSKLGRTVLTGTAADNLFHYPSTTLARQELNLVEVLTQLVKLKHRYGAMPGIGTGLLSRLRSLTSKHGYIYPASYPYPSWLNPDFETKEDLRKHWRERWEPQSKQGATPSRSSALYASLLMPDWTSDDLVMHSQFTFSQEVDPYLDRRMVEFILSVPALPWLFNKDILRRSMEGKLPPEVISRPKTPLGSIRSSVWRQAGARGLDEWPAHPALNQYVQRSSISCLGRGDHDPAAAYVDARPLLLNDWLSQIVGK